MTTDTSPVPYAPLTWEQILVRRDEALKEAGMIAILDHEGVYSSNDDYAARAVVAPAAAYREWMRASAARRTVTEAK